jgi:hypothetical protein
LGLAVPGARANVLSGTVGAQGCAPPSRRDAISGVSREGCSRARQGRPPTVASGHYDPAPIVPKPFRDSHSVRQSGMRVGAADRFETENYNAVCST